MFYRLKTQVRRILRGGYLFKSLISFKSISLSEQHLTQFFPFFSQSATLLWPFTSGIGTGPGHPARPFRKPGFLSPGLARRFQNRVFAAREFRARSPDRSRNFSNFHFHFSDFKYISFKLFEPVRSRIFYKEILYKLGRIG